jgi:hypothetical protein
MNLQERRVFQEIHLAIEQKLSLLARWFDYFGQKLKGG